MSELKKLNISEIASTHKQDFKGKIIAEVDENKVLVEWYGKGQTHPMHKHDRDQFCLVIDGEIQIDSNGKSIKLKKGEGLLIPRGVLHNAKGHPTIRSLVLFFERKDMLYIY